MFDSCLRYSLLAAFVLLAPAAGIIDVVEGATNKFSTSAEVRTQVWTARILSSATIGALYGLIAWHAGRVMWHALFVMTLESCSGKIEIHVGGPLHSIGYNIVCAMTAIMLLLLSTLLRLLHCAAALSFNCPSLLALTVVGSWVVNQFTTGLQRTGTSPA